MAHARRYFEHALDNDKARAEKVLLWMQELYAVEKGAREKTLSAEDRYLLRQQKACLIMDLLGGWLLEEHSKVLPKSAIGKAIYCLLARYNKIYLYLEDGRLEVDNNPVENSIRPVALGRKNGSQMRFDLRSISLLEAMPVLRGQLWPTVYLVVVNYKASIRIYCKDCLSKPSTNSKSYCPHIGKKLL